MIMTCLSYQTHYVDEPVLRPDEDVIHVAIGDMTVITCFVHANPPVERMTWTHNGTVVNVTASKDIVQEVDYRSFNDNSGLLWDAWRLIIPVTPSHYLGIYSCLAATNRGTKQSFVTVSGKTKDILYRLLTSKSFSC